MARPTPAYQIVTKMMRPLSKDEETEAEVTWQDQNNINTFSKLHNKLLDLQDLLTEKNVTLSVTSRLGFSCRD
jgi:hypothetical protein